MAGYKTYIIAAVLALLALFAGADMASVEALATKFGPEIAGLVAAGIAIGRAVKSAFLKVGEVADARAADADAA